MKYEGGFTLLEILMVIVIISMTAAMVVPSFFSGNSVSLEEEGKRLVQVLRLAQDESSLSGQTFRILFRERAYVFQTLSSAGEWMQVIEQPYQPHHFSGAFRVDGVSPSLPLDASNNSDEETEPVVGHLLIPVEGIRQPFDVLLADAGEQLTVQVRPGPGGIRLASEAK